jgi:hypothetical protein
MTATIGDTSGMNGVSTIIFVVTSITGLDTITAQPIAVDITIVGAIGTHTRGATMIAGAIIAASR